MFAHSPALDGLRGIAIILVLLHHFTIIEPATAAGRMAAEIVRIGWCGVDLFFVLSGFLITGILIDARGSARYFSSFYARRTLRIFPLYYLVVFLSLVVLPLAPAWHDLLVGTAPSERLPYWLYLTNFAVAVRDRFLHGVLDIAWSLAIEEQFYLVWAAVVWLCPPAWVGRLCTLVVGAAPLLRVWALARGAEPIDVYVLTFYRADALAVGALAAWLARRGRLDGAGPAALSVAPLLLAGVAAACWLDGGTWWWGGFMQRAGYSLLSLGFGALLVAAVALPPASAWPRWLSTGWLRAFGKYSYCLYLIHLPVMRTVRAHVIGPDEFQLFGTPWVGQLVFYAAAATPALGLAWASWHLFEERILRLKRYFPY